MCMCLGKLHICIHTYILACMHTCMHTCIHPHIHVCMVTMHNSCACVYMHKCMCIHVHVCVCVCVCVSACVCVCACVCTWNMTMCMVAYMHGYIYVYAYVQAYVYMYVYACVRVFGFVCGGRQLNMFQWPRFASIDLKSPFSRLSYLPPRYARECSRWSISVKHVLRNSEIALSWYCSFCAIRCEKSPALRSIWSLDLWRLPTIVAPCAHKLVRMRDIEASHQPNVSNRIGARANGNYPQPAYCCNIDKRNSNRATYPLPDSAWE